MIRGMQGRGQLQALGGVGVVLESGDGTLRNTDLWVVQAVGPTWLIATVTGGKQTRLQLSQSGTLNMQGVLCYSEDHTSGDKDHLCPHY